MRIKYKISNKVEFDNLKEQIKTHCEIRENNSDYIQTYCGIHVKYLGKVVLIPAVIEEDEVITEATYTNHEVIDVMSGECDFFDELEVCEHSDFSHNYS